MFLFMGLRAILFFSMQVKTFCRMSYRIFILHMTYKARGCLSHEILRCDKLLYILSCMIDIYSYVGILVDLVAVIGILSKFLCTPYSSIYSVDYELFQLHHEYCRKFFQACKMVCLYYSV